ncbi:hypothetical protein [Leucobacter ruminantium]|uniref:Uncharacterized protein n=1 Tax=Leucobacter ruminantium TaxID=1289170 RepID=A0A939LX63_9MICO|nr:hypothetical protein [Leucobacter ruminantium]
MEDERNDDAQTAGPSGALGDGELLDRIGLIESQPLAQRAAGFEQLHDELLTELQRSDQGA